MQVSLQAQKRCSRAGVVSVEAGYFNNRSIQQYENVSVVTSIQDAAGTVTPNARRNRRIWAFPTRAFGPISPVFPTTAAATAAAAPTPSHPPRRERRLPTGLRRSRRDAVCAPATPARVESFLYSNKRDSHELFT
jgi:hypothetical protein